MTQETLKVWSWRHAIGQADLQSMTKLLLYTLANYMNEQGTGCYPSISTIIKESGMAKATVLKHLALAIQAGFIKKRKMRLQGQEWAHNEYFACYPDNAELLKDSETVASPLRGTPKTPLKKPAQVHQMDLLGTNEVGSYVHQVDTNTPVNSNISEDKSSGESDASPDEVHVDFKKVIFESGLKYLKRNTGSTEPTLRSLLGKWCRDHGESTVAAVILEASAVSAVDPIAYIQKILKQGGKHGKPVSKHHVPSHRNYENGAEGFELA